MITRNSVSPTFSIECGGRVFDQWVVQGSGRRPSAARVSKKDVLDVRPPMRVDRRRLTGGDLRLENSHLLVFEEQKMMRRRSHESVQLGRP